MTRASVATSFIERLRALRRRPGRTLIVPLILLVLAFAGATAYLGVRLAEEKTTVFSLYRSGAWMAAQLQTEQLRLAERVRRYQAEPTAENRREMMLRFDIFWSRFPVILESEEGRGLRSLDAKMAGVREVYAALPDLERELQALAPERPETFAAVFRRLGQFDEPIQQLALTVLGFEYFDANSDRLSDVQREFTWTYLVLLLAGGLLVACLFWQSRTARELAAHAELAKADTERARSQLQDAIASLSEGFLLLDRDMRVVLVNRRFYDLLPETLRGFAVGDDYRDVIRRSAALGHYGDPAEAETLAAHRIARLEAPGEGLEMSYPDGRQILIHEYVTGDGGRVSLRTDITDLRKAEQDQLDLQARVFRTQKMEALGRLAGGIAHDFNNILMSMQGYAIFLREDLEAGSQQQDFADKIVRSSRRAADLVQQILDFGRQSGGTRTDVRLDRLTAETVGMLRSSLPSQVEIAVAVEDEVPVVTANETQLAQVLMNLCVNACDAIEEAHGTKGGRVAVRLYSVTTDGTRSEQLTRAAPVSLTAPMATETATDGFNHLWVGVIPPARYRVIEVSDNGTGMDLTTLERIFEPFFTTKRQDKGTGLGLAAAHGIVLGHGGAISVKSAPGRGTCIKVLLPARVGEADGEDETEDAAGDAAGDKRRCGGARVLLVDDEPEVVDVARLALSRCGNVAVETANSAPAALERLADDDGFDLVVTDHAMPGMSGLELARSLRDRHPHIAVLLMTGYADGLDAAAAEAAGARRLLSKPLEPGAFCSVVADILESERRAA
jgi:signal transduction histidine kinase/ActR/RegA family two-component response regulator